MKQNFGDRVSVAAITEPEPAAGEEEDEKPLYLQKYPVRDGESTITVVVDGKPWQAGIDPFNELVDRVSDDNRTSITLQ